MAACTTSSGSDSIDSGATETLRQVRSAPFPARYAFTYEPTNIELLDCLVAPDPELSGTVDSERDLMALRVRDNPERSTLVTPAETLVHRSLVDPAAATEWLRLDAATSSAALGAARAQLGPGFASFVLPPRLPEDPNKIVLAVADAAARITFNGIGDMDGRPVRRIRIVTDPTKVDGQISESGVAPAASAADAPRRGSIIDASVDEKGRVVRLEISTATVATGSVERDTHEPSYVMTFTQFETAAVPAMPDPATVGSYPETRPRPPAGSEPGCTVQVGPPTQPTTTRPDDESSLGVTRVRRPTRRTHL
jgi:hypothetical protein